MFKNVKRNQKMAQHLVKAQDGFSLVEILVALTLLGIAGTFVVGKIFDQLEQGKITSASIQMNGFKAQLQEFRRRCGFYPSTEQGLDALVNKPAGGRDCKRYPPEGFVDGGEIPNDPWDMPYEYVLDGGKYDIISSGTDAEMGTDDDIHLNKKKGDSESSN